MCAPTAVGSYTLNASVVDAARYTVWKSLPLLVEPPPSVTRVAVTPSALDVGQSTVIAVTEEGGTPPFTYSFTGLPPGCPSANTSSLACAPTLPGAYSVDVQVTDADGWYASGTVPLTVSPDPAIADFAGAPAVLDVGTSLHVWLNASGGTGSLSYSVLGAPGRLPVGRCRGG